MVVPNVAITTAQAQQKKGLPLVRDAETEDLLREYAKPVFRAAGLPTNQVEIILVNDKSFNAFVPDSRRMFINLGVIMEAKTPGEVIGVIAHETGHIAGNHLVRMRQAASSAQIMSVIGMILGAGAIAAGATTGNSSIAQGGAAAVTGGGPSHNEISCLTVVQKNRQLTKPRYATLIALVYLPKACSQHLSAWQIRRYFQPST